MQFMADNRQFIYVNDTKLQRFAYQLWPQEDYYCKNYQLIHLNGFFDDLENVNAFEEDNDNDDDGDDIDIDFIINVL